MKMHLINYNSIAQEIIHSWHFCMFIVGQRCDAAENSGIRIDPCQWKGWDALSNLKIFINLLQRKILCFFHIVLQPYVTWAILGKTEWEKIYIQLVRNYLISSHKLFRLSWESNGPFALFFITMQWHKISYTYS